jgi:hypothetical protein
MLIVQLIAVAFVFLGGAALIWIGARLWDGSWHPADRPLGGTLIGIGLAAFAVALGILRAI